MLSEWARRNGFWAMDYLRGGRVRHHLNEIRYIMENHTLPSVHKMQRDYLDRILQYAKREVPFYGQAARAVLSDFPIVDKNIIKANYSDFQSPQYVHRRVHELSTSGSTGTPFVVRQDQNKRNRVYAEMMYFWEKAGFSIGQKYVFFRVWTEANRKGRLDAWARNVVMHNVVRLDQDSLDAIRQLLASDHRIKMLLGYASTFESLAAFLDSRDDRPESFSIKTILSSSEALRDLTRERLKRTFDCNVISLYPDFCS